MKILWHSNMPFVPSGYGQQTALFAPRLAALGHDVGLSSVYGLAGAGIEWNGMRCYPTDNNWGNTTLKQWAAHHADGDECLTIVLIDAWVLDPKKMPSPLAVWVPVDHNPIPPAVRDFFKRSKATPIAMSQFGLLELTNAGFDPLYVPHGFDADVFHPRTPEERMEIRRKANIPEDAFVVGIVAANKGAILPRKAFPVSFQAFSRFREQHRDAFLYVHSEAFPEDGVNLSQCARACDIPLSCIRWTNPISLQLGVMPEDIAGLHSSFDVLLNPSFGEGFGIPIIEAQACGTPVIVTDWTAMPELCGAGWKLEGKRWYDPTNDSWFRQPMEDEILDALNEAYDNAHVMRDAAARFAVDYAADTVVGKYWKPALEQLSQPRVTEVPPLPGAEYMETVAA